MSKIFRRFVFKSLQLSFIVLWHLKLDYFMSKFIGIVTVCYNKKEFALNKNKKAILAMERGVFDYDVKAIKEYPSKYIIIIYPTLARSLLSDDAEWLHPEEILEQTSFYTNKDKYKWLYDRLSNIYSKVLDTIESFGKVKVKVVLTANIDYFQDYPWIKAIHNKNGKFVVLEKESIVFKKTELDTLTARHNKYGFKYDGDAVLLYNELAKDIYCRIGSIKPNQTFITGCPRVDRLTALSKNKSEKSNFALFTSFMEPQHFGAGVCEEILKTIYEDELLRKKVIIKCKYAKEAEEIKKMYPGVTAVSDTVENYLIKNPAIFIGYNSTICYDALIAGIPVVIPFWGETKEGDDDRLVGKHTSDFHLLAYDKKSLVKIIKDYLTNNTKEYMEPQTVWSNPSLKRFLEERYSNVDGDNCKRFFETIDEIIKSSNNQN